MEKCVSFVSRVYFFYMNLDLVVCIYEPSIEQVFAHHS